MIGMSNTTVTYDLVKLASRKGIEHEVTIKAIYEQKIGLGLTEVFVGYIAACRCGAKTPIVNTASPLDVIDAGRDL